MKNILVGVTLLVLVACSSKPLTTGKHTDIGMWTGKVQMTNKTTNHKKWANVVWASDSESDRMRIDVSAIMDVPIATFIKNGEGSHLWLFTEKKYFHSQDGEKLFKHLTKLSVDPRIFYSMLGQPRPPGSQWSCKDKSDVYQCSSSQEKTRFMVKHEEPDERIIKIEKGLEALQIRLSRSKVQVKEQLFKALSTSQFKTIQI